MEKLGNLFTKDVDVSAVDAWMAFAESVKDKAPAEQAALLGKEIEKTNQSIVAYSKERQKLAKDLANYDGKFAKQKKIDTKQQIEVIDKEQDSLLAVRKIYEQQLAVLKQIVTEQAKVTEGLPSLKKVTLPPPDEPGLLSDPNFVKGLSWARDPSGAGASPVVGKTIEQLEAINALGGSLDATIAGWADGWDKAFGSETFDKVSKVQTEVGKVGASVGMMLVSQFDSLGEAIGRTMAGAEGALKSLGLAIMQNLGNILIMAGFAMGPAGLPLILAGIGLQLGGGIIKGLGDKVDSRNSSSAYGSQGNVQFQISGQNLVGVLNRQNNRMDRFT